MSNRLADSSEESLNLVRRRILAITWVVTSIHGLFGTIGAAYALGTDRRSDQIILLIVSVPLAFIIFGVTRVILDRKIFTRWSLPWLAVLLAPSVAAFFWIL